jgi:FKBP-type peptidyl-prolyl cis-trans isomerase 2
MVTMNQTSKKSATPQSKIKTKKGDFVEIDFVGKIKATGQIFDLTVEDVAKKEGIHQPKVKYEPLVAQLGSGQLIEGFDAELTDVELGKELEFDVPTEKAFGRKNPKMIQLTSLALLKKRGVNPALGMQLNIDGAVASVRSVSGGRVILDFNHPLSGKELHYWVKVKSIITDTKKKTEAVINALGVPAKVSVKDKTVTLKMEQKVPKQITDVISAEIKKSVPDVKIAFSS